MNGPTVLARDLLWEETELASAVIALASAARLRPQRAASELEQGWAVETERSIRVSMAAVGAGVEADHASPRHGEVPWLLRRGTPALIEVPGEGHVGPVGVDLVDAVVGEAQHDQRKRADVGQIPRG